MHNKSFTVDGVATVVGGRNIGAEYFAAREDVNFGDLDLLGFGPVARDVTAAFDEYWNDALAVPIADLIRPKRPGWGPAFLARASPHRSRATSRVITARHCARRCSIACRE